MGPAVIKSPLARRDLIEAADYYGQIDPALSDRLLSAAEETFGLLAGMPHLGAPRQYSRADITGLRMMCVKGFEKYLVFYRPLPSGQGIEVVRVLHGARDIESLFA